MKIKNLLLVPLLSAALVATSACTGSGEASSSGSDSSEPSTSQPGQKVVSRITVKSRLNSVVGEILDLDTLVDVHYEDGTTSKDYTAEAQLASKDLVKIDGHKVEFLGEGTVNISLKSGGQSAKFSTTVLTKLKKDFVEVTSKIGTNFAYYEVYEDASGQMVAEHFATHAEDYTCFQAWDDDAAGKTMPGGFLKSQKGRTYSYLLDSNYENIEVDPTPWGAFDDYLVNMPFAFDTADLATKADDLGDYLVLDAKAPATYSKFSSFIEEFCYCQLAFQINSKFKFRDIEIREIEPSETEEVAHFLFTLNILKKSDGSLLTLDLLLIYEDDQQYGIDPVREYIDSGSEPAGTDTTAITSKFVDMREAKNFTVEISADERETTTSGELVPGTEKHLYDETILANEHQYEDVIYGVNETTGASELAAGEGLVENEGALYSYTVDGDTNPAQLVGAGKTVYVDGIAATLVSLMDETTLGNIFASSVETEAGIDYYRIPIEINADFLKSWLSLTYSGTPILNWLEYALEKYQKDLFNDTYAEAYFMVGADSFQFSLDMFMGATESGTYSQYKVTASIKEVGSTAAIPTVITYPTAA